MKKIFVSDLDKTLRFLKDNRTDKKGITDKQIVDGCFDGVESWDFLDIVNQLLTDKLAYRIFISEGVYNTNLNHTGRLFIENAGYKGKFNRDRIKDYLDIISSWGTFLGVIAAGAYGIFEIWKYYHGFVRPCP